LPSSSNRLIVSSLVVLLTAVISGAAPTMRPHARRGALPVDSDRREEEDESCASFTATLREEAIAEWTLLVEEPFTDSLAAGTLENRLLIRYLVQDHAFLDAFTSLLASMVAVAELPDRAEGAAFLALVTSTENTYFERAFEALGVSKAMRAAPLEPETRAFEALMRRAAGTRKLHAMLAVLVVAEWSYLSWADRVVPAMAPGLAFYHREWIDLHTGDYFRSVVQYLRDLLDRLAAFELSAEERDEAREYFMATVAAERDFWAMVHRGGERPPPGPSSSSSREQQPSF